MSIFAVCAVLANGYFVGGYVLIHQDFNGGIAIFALGNLGGQVVGGVFMAVFLIRTNYRNLAAQFVGDAGLVVVSGKFQARIDNNFHTTFDIPNSCPIGIYRAATLHIGDLGTTQIDVLIHPVNGDSGRPIGNGADIIQRGCQLNFQLSINIIYTNIAISKFSMLCPTYHIQSFAQLFGDNRAVITSILRPFINSFVDVGNAAVFGDVDFLAQLVRIQTYFQSVVIYLCSDILIPGDYQWCGRINLFAAGPGIFYRPLGMAFHVVNIGRISAHISAALYVGDLHIASVNAVHGHRRTIIAYGQPFILHAGMPGSHFGKFRGFSHGKRDAAVRHRRLKILSTIIPAGSFSASGGNGQF